MRELPLLYKLQEGNDTTFFLVRDPEKFYDIWTRGVGFDIHQNKALKDSLLKVSPLGPDYDILKRLVEKHGTRMTKGEVMKGKVVLASSLQQEHRGYTEYRFKGLVPDDWHEYNEDKGKDAVMGSAGPGKCCQWKMIPKSLHISRELSALAVVHRSNCRVIFCAVRTFAVVIDVNSGCVGWYVSVAMY